MAVPTVCSVLGIPSGYPFGRDRVDRDSRQHAGVAELGSRDRRRDLELSVSGVGQWQVHHIISVATSATYTIISVAAGDAGSDSPSANVVITLARELDACLRE